MTSSANTSGNTKELYLSIFILRYFCLYSCSSVNHLLPPIFSSPVQGEVDGRAVGRGEQAPHSPFFLALHHFTPLLLHHFTPSSLHLFTPLLLPSIYSFFLPLPILQPIPPLAPNLPSTHCLSPAARHNRPPHILPPPSHRPHLFRFLK